MKKFTDITLSIEMIPASSWFNNVRAYISQYRWRKIRKIVLDESNQNCTICDSPAKDAHEVWSYSTTGTQKLEAIVALCRRCHEVKHIGLTIERNRYKSALAHLMSINKWPKEVAELYVEENFLEWKKRSERPWKLDVKLLEKYGVESEKIHEIQAHFRSSS